MPASTEQVSAEAAAVAKVAAINCPVRAVLERVVATAGGVLVACWQVRLRRVLVWHEPQEL